MRHYLSKRLARLASLAMQRRYMVRATLDNHLLPEDLLNDAYDVIKHARTSSAARDALSSAAIDKITALEPLLEAVNLIDKNWAQLVEHDDAWRIAREHAAKCLEAMGFDLVEWERAEGVGTPSDT